MGVEDINDELELVTVPLRGACELEGEELGEEELEPDVTVVKNWI
jgi:hypothetical protein